MGLDAHVCCNCIKEGVAPPHPFPELLAFDETAGPVLKSDHEVSLERWIEHDAWHRTSCPHSGYLLKKQLGNLTLIAHVRAYLDLKGLPSFPVLKQRVVYNGTHEGDWIGSAEASCLLEEARKLREIATIPVVAQFAGDMIELAEASVQSGNPIVF
jgi:hypothetical protein